MSLQPEEVERVALLARLELSPSEIEAMSRQLSQIVEYVTQLSELNTDNVPPMDHAIEITNVMREDRLVPMLPRERALQNAPKQDGEYYLVPAVLGE